MTDICSCMRTHTHSVPKALCAVLWASNVLSLRFNFSRRLCSACLIWVLNKLPWPCSHFLSPFAPRLLLSPHLPPSLVLLFFLPLILEGSIALLVVHNPSSNKRKHLLVLKNELPCSPSPSLQDTVCYYLAEPRWHFASSQTGRVGLCSCAVSLSKFHEFYSRGSQFRSHKTCMTFSLGFADKTAVWTCLNYIFWTLQTQNHQVLPLRWRAAACHPLIFW